MNDSRTRILVVITRAQRRGAELEAAQLVAALGVRGLDVRLLALAPSSTTGLELEVDVAGPNVRSLATVRAVRRAARDADLVVAFGSSTLPVCALGLLGTGRRFVYRSIGDPAAWAGGRLRRMRTGWLMRRAAAVAALWPAAGHSISALYRVNPLRVHVVPNGRDPALFTIATGEQRRAARRRFDVAAGTEADDPATAVGLVAGFVGALSAEKNPLAAIDAAAASSHVTTLIVAGDGPMRALVEASAAEVGDGRGGRSLDVRVTGVIDDVATLYHAIDLLIAPSATEGMPGALIEAQLCGVPVVASRVGAVEHVVAPNAGHVLDADAGSAAWAAAIDDVGAASARHAPTAAAIRAWTVERFDSAAVVATWHQLLVALADRR